MSSEPSKAVVVARNLSRRFGSVVAIDSVNLALTNGQIFGVVGADGSGKTTLLQMMAGILDPTDGACNVLGFDSVKQANEVTARIGYMSQGFTLYERLTVTENIEFAAVIRGVERTQLQIRRERLLDMAGLGRFLARRAGQLSGGMKKKLALCTNLIHEPPLLLLDEPSLGVDPISRRDLWRLLEDYRQRGATIVLATSYLDEADRCDGLLLLQKGRELVQGTPSALRAELSGSIFEIDAMNPTSVERVLAADEQIVGVKRLPNKLRFQTRSHAQSSNEVIAQARSMPPQLEDIFLAQSPPLSVETAAREGDRVATNVESTRPSATVRVRDVTCRFGDFTAVNSVSLDLNAGEVVGFLGPNGAGKTTLMRILCGLQRFQSGQVEVAGLALPRQAKSLRARIGYMSQQFSLYPDLTVDENINFFAGIYPLRAETRAHARRWAVTAAALDGLEERKVADISAAVRQRLALACSAMHRPAVLFLDEPTAGVDPVSRGRFWRLVRDLAAQLATVVVTTHFMEEAVYCDRVGLMNQGALVGLGSIDELRARAGLSAASSVEDTFIAYMEKNRLAA